MNRDVHTVVRYVHYFERVLTIVPEIDQIFDNLVACKVAVRYVANFVSWDV